jgi:hypothetical protein
MTQGRAIALPVTPFFGVAQEKVERIVLRDA